MSSGLLEKQKLSGQARGSRATTVTLDPDRGLHPAWLEFVHYCEDLGHGDIERLRIQNGLPLLAEVTTKKVKFS